MNSTTDTTKTRYGYVYHFVFTRPRDEHEFHYVGQHLGSKADPKYFCSGIILKRLINKYGRKGNLIRHGLIWCHSRDELNFSEILMICFAKQVYGDDCINLNHGGVDGRREEYSRAKQSETMKALFKSTEGKKIRVKISDSLKAYFDSPDGEVAKINISKRTKGKLLTKEHLINRGVSIRAHYASPEGDLTRARRSESIKRHYESVEGDVSRSKLSDSLIRHYRSSAGDAHRASVREASIGRPCTKETRDKLRASNVGQKRTQQTKANLRAAAAGRLGKALTPEHRAKMSESHKGKVLSPEHRDSLRAGWARRRALLRIL